MTTTTARDPGEEPPRGPLGTLLTWIGRSVYRLLLVIAIVWAVGLVVGLFLDGGPGGGSSVAP